MMLKGAEKKMDTYGDILKRIRRGLGLSQEAMAQRIGVTKGSVWNWEAEYNVPDAKAVARYQTLTTPADAAALVDALAHLDGWSAGDNPGHVGNGVPAGVVVKP
jgi:transcriptional regulator with XRE-family HTH domain